MLRGTSQVLSYHSIGRGEHIMKDEQYYEISLVTPWRHVQLASFQLFSLTFLTSFSCCVPAPPPYKHECVYPHPSIRHPLRSHAHTLSSTSGRTRSSADSSLTQKVGRTVNVLRSDGIQLVAEAEARRVIVGYLSLTSCETVVFSLCLLNVCLPCLLRPCIIWDGYLYKT